VDLQAVLAQLPFQASPIPRVHPGVVVDHDPVIVEKSHQPVAVADGVERFRRDDDPGWVVKSLLKMRSHFGAFPLRVLPEDFFRENHLRLGRHDVAAVNHEVGVADLSQLS